MKKKILLHYLILVIIGMSITGFFTSKLAQHFYMYEVEDRLVSAASLIQYQLAEDISKGANVDYNTVAANYAAILNNFVQSSSIDKDLDARVTFIDFHGRVLGDSLVNYHEMENHIDREEIQEAIQGKTGKDVRFSRTLKVEFLYIAVPLNPSNIILRISVPLIRINRINEIIWYYTLVGILAGLLLTMLPALKFSESLTRPINELISTSREISLGNYSKRVNIKSNDELGQLSGTFNKMASELEKTVADLKDKNIKVDSIISSMTNGIVAVDTNFKVILINPIACEMFNVKDSNSVIGANILELIRNSQINSYLRETVEKNVSSVNEIIFSPPREKVLRVYTNPIKAIGSEGSNSGGIISIHDITNIKKLEQIRTEFVSNVTHELKTPLTSIRGFIETLRGGAIDNKGVADKFLEIIDIEAERLYTLINDILQLSEIESKQKDTNIGIHDLKEIIGEVLSILKGIAENKNIALKLEADTGITIAANRNRIKQMLINLIENAIKYNITGGNVLAKAYKTEGKIVISIKDTGIGIPAQHIPRIFERFYRVDKGRSRNMGGTGLGLSIVKHIVNLYNGDIKVTSEPGKGTEFIVQLPV
jgi:two-component system phosphate regulon sensor histidine kinase PhoR